MGEQPIFTCQAHVFTINPSTRKTWVQSSSKAVDINFFYDSAKQCYRIVSVEDGPTGSKVVINSTVTPKMVFKQTSQKFGQWADPKSSGVFGLGFDSEFDLNKFVAQFRQCVEAMKRINGESTGQVMAKQTESQPSTLKNNQLTSLPIPSLSTSPNPPLPNTFHSGNDPIPVESFSIGNEGRQVMHPQYNKDHIQRLEGDFETVRRQTSKQVNSTSPSSLLKTNVNDGDLLDGPERVHPSSVSGSGGNGIGPTTGAKGNTSIEHRVPLSFLGSTGRPLWGEVPSELMPQGEVAAMSESSLMLLKLHGRLGRILQEACDLHKQIGQLLVTGTKQST